MAEWRRFLRELPGWLLRGAACALPSAWFAGLAFDFAPAMLAGISIGFVVVVAAFGAACSRLAPEETSWGWALSVAAWVRAGLGIGPGLCLDVLTGAMCMDFFERAFAHAGASQLVMVIGITLAQGAIVSLEVFLIAAALLLSGLVSRRS